MGEFIELAAANNRERAKKRAGLEDMVWDLGKEHHHTRAPRIWRALWVVRTQLAALDTDWAEYILLRLQQSFYPGRTKLAGF